MGTLTSYVEELQGYVADDKVSMVILASLTLFLWRGTHKCTLFGHDIQVPVHSIIAFIWGVLVTNDFNRFPSFVVFSIAWFFLVCMEQNRQHPSPWHHCESYWDLLHALLVELSGLSLGKYSKSIVARPKETIAPNENIDQIRPYLEAIQRKKEVEEQMKLRKAVELEEEVQRHQAEMQDISASNVETVRQQTIKRFLNTNPLVPILHPIQNILYIVVKHLRVIKSIVTWDENYYPFWIVTCCLVISMIIFWIPWGSIIRCMVRILVWIVLGPWMRILDKYYFAQIEHMTPEEQERHIQEQARQTHKAFQAKRLQSRTARENRVKLKSMMKYFFGKVCQFGLIMYLLALYPDPSHPTLFSMLCKCLDSRWPSSSMIHCQHLLLNHMKAPLVHLIEP